MEFSKKLAENSKTNCNLDVTKKLEEQELQEESRDLIALLFTLYIADEKERKYIRECWEKNEEQYNQIQREKYDVNKIFQKNNDNFKEKGKMIERETSLVQYKESTLKKLFNKLLKILHLKK